MCEWWGVGSSSSTSFPSSVQPTQAFAVFKLCTDAFRVFVARFKSPQCACARSTYVHSALIFLKLYCFVIVVYCLLFSFVIVYCFFSSFSHV